MFPFRLFGWLLASSIMLFACNDPTNLGADLLSQDQEDVVYTDSITLLTEHSFEDSLRVYSSASRINGLVLGTWDDPYFGTNSSEFYIQITPGSQSLPTLNDFEVDSVILAFEIDSVRSYGLLDNPVDFEVYEMTEAFDNDTSYYTNTTFEIEASPLATGSELFDLEESKSLVTSESDTAFTKMIKIELPDLFGKTLLDSSLLVNFDDQFFGLHVKNVSASASQGMGVLLAESAVTSVNVYYTNRSSTDTSNLIYRFLVSPLDVRTVKLDNDITGSSVEQAINSGDDELLYLQGLNGPNIKLTFPHIEELGNIIVNSAFIEFTVADLLGDDLDVYPPPDQLILFVEDDELGFLAVDDIGQGLSLFDVFGGDFAVQENIAESIAGIYRLNISDYFQKVVDGERTNELFLQTFPKSYDPSRAILYGNGSAHRPQLKLTYTRINP